MASRDIAEWSCCGRVGERRRRLGLGWGRRGGRHWLHVRLPGRPNQHTGWIRSLRTIRFSTPWRIAVDLSARRVTVYRAGTVKRRFAYGAACRVR